MSESIDFIKDRAVKTISAAKQVAATWTWAEKPVADIETQLEAITGNSSANPPVIGQEETVAAAEQVMKDARSTWDAQLDVLHRRTMQGLSMARTRYRNDPANLSQLNGLTAKGDSRQAILDEALEWEAAWGNLDAAWAPLPANTLPAFKTLRKQCNEDFKKVTTDAQAAWRKEANKLGQMGADMEDVNVAWYADATRVFPEGTPEGDMIRGTIPTTYNPPPDKPTPPAPPTP